MNTVQEAILIILGCPTSERTQIISLLDEHDALIRKENLTHKQQREIRCALRQIAEKLDKEEFTI